MNNEQLYNFINGIINSSSSTTQEEQQDRYSQLNKILRNETNLKQIMEITISLSQGDNRLLLGYINLINQSLYQNMKSIKYSQFKRETFSLIIMILANNCEKQQCYRRLQEIVTYMMSGTSLEDFTAMISMAVQLLTEQQDISNYAQVLQQLSSQRLLCLSIIFLSVCNRRTANIVNQQTLSEMKEHVIFPTIKHVVRSINCTNNIQHLILENAVKSLTKLISGLIPQYVQLAFTELIESVMRQHQSLNINQPSHYSLQLACLNYYDQVVKTYHQQKRNNGPIAYIYETNIFQPLFQFILNQLQNSNDNEEVNTLVIQVITKNLVVFKYIGQISNNSTNQLFTQLNEYVTGKLQQYFEQNIYNIDLECAYNQQGEFLMDYNVELFNFLGIQSKKSFVNVIINFYKEQYSTQLNIQELISVTKNQINTVISIDRTKFSQIYSELIRLLSLVSIISTFKMQHPDLVQQTFQCVYNFYSQTLQQLHSLQNYIALTFLQLVEQYFVDAKDYTINQVMDLLLTVYQYFKVATQQTAFICSLIFIRRRIEQLQIKTNIDMNNQQQIGQFSQMLLQNPAIVDVLVQVSQMMVQVNPEFMYYTELFEVTSYLTKILAPVYIDTVAELYQNIFNQILEQYQNCINNVNDSSQKKKLMSHFMNYMEIFSNVFINRYASIEGDAFMVYYQIIVQHIYIYLQGYQLQQYQEVKLLCTCLCYLLSNPSCVDVFDEISNNLLELANNIVIFAAKSDNDHAPIVMQLLFTICDCFYVNDQKNQLYTLIYNQLKQIISQDVQKYRRLFMILRFCASYLYTSQQGDVNDILTVYFSQQIDNSYVDCSYKTIYTMIYISIFNLSVQSNVDLLNMDQFSDLKNYLFSHASMVPDNSITKIFLAQCYQYAQAFSHVEQLAKLPDVLSTNRYQINNILDNKRYIVNLNLNNEIVYQEGTSDLYELFESTSYLSTELQHQQPFKQ